MFVFKGREKAKKKKSQIVTVLLCVFVSCLVVRKMLLDRQIYENCIFKRKRAGQFLLTFL